MVVNPAVATKRLDVKSAAGPQARRPVVPGDRQRHQEARRRRVRLRPHPAARDPLLHRELAGDHRGPAEGDRAAALLPLARGPRRGRLVRAGHPRRGLLHRRHPRRVCGTDFHVATLDNDAPTIFERSAAFVARVSAT
ncbi:hypothetical protein [Nocardioides convexus]|uniref:hypothetical protein n=1 Tax=Nocardioides convexus TaxID=2712224 RepID=UPI00241871B2|nr:hypothetical protein [Nocardioides convexus]